MCDKKKTVLDMATNKFVDREWSSGGGDCCRDLARYRTTRNRAQTECPSVDRADSITDRMVAICRGYKSGGGREVYWYK